MLDLKFIRENTEQVKAGLARKGAVPDLAALLEFDRKRRELLTKTDEWRTQINAANVEIGRLRKDNKDASPKIAAMKGISRRIDELEPAIRELDGKIHSLVLAIPNLPHVSVPAGGADKNVEVKRWGKPPQFAFKPKTHVELGESLDIIDFKRGAKLSGSNFILFKNEGALLVRALVNFMLDIHTRHHGYQEVYPPVLVNTESMTGTGQLPKMREDMYKLEHDELFLIPTAEVPVTNIHRDETLLEEDLPVYYTAYSLCFRREAGSYGKDTRGLVRVHQFDKVEMVKFVKPEHSYNELESLTADAGDIFERLGLPYRVLKLASGDLSFAAAKCYDLEVYAAGMDKWLEASSCSNFEDFQARRANIRFKGKDLKKSAFVHTLNGSGVALPRTLIALLENGQTPEGNVLIPDALQSYMGGLKSINPK